MKKITKVFVLTTEYHFLLSMSIIVNKYGSGEFRNILIFTGHRLSGVAVDALPSFIEVVTLFIDEDKKLKEKVDKIIVEQVIRNLFVFTAYRFFETYMLNKISKSTQRHLVQDGANFYFNIKKSVFVSRLKETLKIYLNLWRRGFFFLKPVLYKKHLAQCSFVDFVWLTSEEIYHEPKFSKKPLIKIKLFSAEAERKLLKYFKMDEKVQYNNYLIYFSLRLTQKDAVLKEIAVLKSILAKVGKPNLLIKLHPNATDVQVELFKEAFGDQVIKNQAPGELYVLQAKDTCVVGTASAVLYDNNTFCSYFSLIKIYQQLKIFPNWLEVSLPNHVKIIETIHDMD
ncbi:MAG TPA: hypothetical protein VFF27_01255 [Bacteroidia bacterium]|jgi:hypothetical protein|nr:hypothetical protein [Bacteroidia bacterium]